MKKLEILEYAAKGAWQAYCEAMSEWEKEPENESLKRVVERHSEKHQELYDMWMDELRDEVNQMDKELDEPSEYGKKEMSDEELIRAIQDTCSLANEETEDMVRKNYLINKFDALTQEAWDRGIEI